MKRSLFYLIIILIDTATAFFACTKESSYEGSVLVIDAKNVLNNSWRINSVEARMFKTKTQFISLAKSDYQNASFTLILPNIIAKENLDGDDNGRLGLVEIGTYNVSGNLTGALFLADTVKKVQVHYTYADRNFNVHGTFDFEGIEYSTQVWDCSFVKGWNMLYVEVIDNKTISFTTEQPSGINLQWYFSKPPLIDKPDSWKHILLLK